ncbi:MAG: flagellin [Clostridia bacterium]|nr:flagellin [Clostridia bacterium]
MIINHNIAALNTYRQLSSNNVMGQKSLEKLSSGLRINRAGDDAAGLAISEKMRAQIRGLDQAARNAQDGISMIQTAEGALNEVHSILQRMRELANQAANDTNVTVDRAEIQKEINQLTSEINRIGNTTEFNTQKLLNGDMSVIEAGTEVTITNTKSATYTPVFALGTTWTNQDGKKPVISDGANDNQIAFSSFDIDGTNDFSWDIDTGETNRITIERSGDDILISIVATDTDGDALSITNDKMAYDGPNGKYVYDANGVKFEITAAEFEKFNDGGKLEIDLNAYAGGAGNVDLTSQTVGTVSDYSQTLSGGGSTFGSFAAGIEVDITDAEWIDGVVGIKITGTGLDATGGTLKIELLDAGGDALVTEEFTIAAGAGDITYDNHGVSFTYTIEDTSNLQLEMDFDTVTTTATTTATVDNSAKFQIGANTGQSMSVDIKDMRSVALGVSSNTASAEVTVKDNMGNDIKAYFTAVKTVTNGTDNKTAEYALDVSTHDRATAAIKVINDAIEKVSTERSKLGAYQNRLEHTINNLGTSSENLSAAESRIRDVDMAKEMMEFTKMNILSQAAQAMLAQANQQPQGVLQLLR